MVVGRRGSARGGDGVALDDHGVDEGAGGGDGLGEHDADVPLRAEVADLLDDLVGRGDDVGEGAGEVGGGDGRIAGAERVGLLDGDRERADGIVQDASAVKVLQQT